MKTTLPYTTLSDADLLAEVERLAQCERDATVQLIASLAEIDRRRIYLAQGFSSLFTYCTQRLRLAEGAAYRRIEAARASRRFPVLLEKLEDGSLTLATLVLLVPHLTAGNHAGVLESARHKSKREVEILAASLRPLPAVPSVVRRLPEVKVTPSRMSAAPVETEKTRPMPPPSRRPIVAPLSETQFKLQVTISKRGHDLLRELQDLMRHSNPSGDPAIIVERALALLHADVLRRKAGITTRPRNRRAADPEPLREALLSTGAEF